MITALTSLTIFGNLFLGLYVFQRNPDSISNRLFSLMALIGVFWAFTNFMTLKSASIFWYQSSYALGALVISSGLIWILTFTKNHNKRYIITIVLFAICFFGGSFIPGFIINPDGQASKGALFLEQWGLTLYTLFYLFSSCTILYLLYNLWSRTHDIGLKWQSMYIFIGALVTLLTTALSSFILPLFSIFLFEGIDNIGFLIFITIIAYTITKHRLFSIKVLAIELVTFILWIILFIKLITASGGEELMIQAFLFLVSLIFGFLLIRNALHEFMLHEKIAQLTTDLKKAYEQIRRN